MQINPTSSFHHRTLAVTRYMHVGRVDLRALCRGAVCQRRSGTLDWLDGGTQTLVPQKVPTSLKVIQRKEQTEQQQQ